MSTALKRRHAVASMTNAIEDMHTQVDRAIAGAARLIVKTLEAREEIGVSGTLGQDELENMQAGMGSLVGIRRHYIGSHSLLAEFGRNMGLPIVADGGFPKHPAASVGDDLPVAA